MLILDSMPEPHSSLAGTVALLVRRQSNIREGFFKDGEGRPFWQICPGACCVLI